MGNVCPRCGGPTQESDVFCGKCGWRLGVTAPAAGTATPVKRPPRKKNPLRPAANLVMRNIAFVLMAILVFTLVLGISHFVAKQQVTVTAVAKYGGEVQREQEKMPLKEIYEAEEFIGLAITGLAYGVFNLVLSVYAGILVVNRFRGNGRLKRQVKNYAITGLAGNGTYLFLIWLLGSHKESYSNITLKATVSPHFTVWLCLILFGLLLAAAMLSRSKRRR